MLPWILVALANMTLPRLLDRLNCDSSYIPLECLKPPVGLSLVLLVLTVEIILLSIHCCYSSIHCKHLFISTLLGHCIPLPCTCQVIWHLIQMNFSIISPCNELNLLDWILIIQQSFLEVTIVVMTLLQIDIGI